MENKLIKLKYYLVFTLIFIGNSIFGQGNPGFLGKKMAVGFSKQYSLVNTIYFQEYSGKDRMNTLTNNDLYIEYATSKYRSITAHCSYQKVPLFNAGFLDEGGQVNSPYIYAGENSYANLSKSGQSEYSYWNVGFQYNMYLDTKTIAAPIGFCYYARFDVHSIKAIKNTFVYSADNFYPNDPEMQVAISQIDRSASNSKTTNFSIGIGSESKLIISRSVFLRLNGECNLSTIGITKTIQEDLNYSYSNTVKDDLRSTGQSLNRFRNLFLFGLGLGVLL